MSTSRAKVDMGTRAKDDAEVVLIHDQNQSQLQALSRGHAATSKYGGVILTENEARRRCSAHKK